ncbi:hypothetical protein N7533_001533 [Penicillium manginii]|uniref:uncharacterized protein n=1 Tax=Penicillium manginii TaxID=203109 RepID=UPI002548B083|nr:uncharacterized protein N7533_001533 [Penicillium manginii]KAJ5762852.1 hypothetical protein N7533_001533 [Penicillium manginii]
MTEQRSINSNRFSSSRMKDRRVFALARLDLIFIFGVTKRIRRKTPASLNGFHLSPTDLEAYDM